MGINYHINWCSQISEPSTVVHAKQLAKLIGNGGRSKVLNHDSFLWYCWWTKSCTTKDDDYPIIYRVLTIPGGAGFCPSTVPWVVWWFSLLFEGAIGVSSLGSGSGGVASTWSAQGEEGLGLRNWLMSCWWYMIGKNHWISMLEEKVVVAV